MSLALSLALSACGSEAPDPVPAETVDVPVAADGPKGVSLTDAQVRMPAVGGRPGSAYFMISSDEPRTITGVAVMGAGRTEMHESAMVDGVMSMKKVETVALEPGEPHAFKTGGHHVMLFDMDATIAPGGTTDLTITFDNGDKASIAAKVVGAGGMDMGDHDMAGMEH
ncbi:copper chaperone PCu(A)C [Croceicoccus ponticola]|nr:copper chaperone PCu(A)C [Croceicoccus ponticola]